MTRCFVPGCMSGLEFEKKKSGTQNISFFTAKTDDSVRVWAKVINRKDRVLTKNSKVCELHFHEEDIDKEYICRMPDGSVYIVPKNKKVLKKGSVPCIFSNRPRAQRKFHIEADPLYIVEEVKPSVYEIFKNESNYDEVVRFLTSIPLPSAYWVGKICPTFIVWNCWTEDLMHSYKRVVLTCDFVIRVYIENMELNKESYIEVKNVADIVQLLQNVATLFPCIEREIPRSKNCRGFVLPIDPNGHRRQSSVCYECSKYRCEVRRKLRNQYIETEITQRKNDVMHKRFKTMSHQNSKLASENMKLKKNVEGMTRLIKIMSRRLLEYQKTNVRL